MSAPDKSWFATCPRGVESLLAAELATLGALATKETVAGVSFSGPQVVAYRACLWTRLANRIVMPLGQMEAGDGDVLYAGLRTVDWPQLFDGGASIAVDFTGSNRAIRNTQFGAQRTKDAIVDTFAAVSGARPSVDRSGADVRINVRLQRDRAHIGLDLSGGSLHRRGYRGRAGAAPLKENLAAAILLRADWPAMAARGGALIDPMCGSGTLLIEGAMMAADIAPGLARARFGFERLLAFDEQQWRALVADARGRRERGLAAQLPEIRGYDASSRVIRDAMDNIARAGLEQHVRVSARPLHALKKPTHKPIEHGLLVTNPPYGERLGVREELGTLYAQLGARMLAEFPGWQAAVFTCDRELARSTGLRSHKQYTLFNGTIETQLFLFDLAHNELRETQQRASPAAELSPGAQMFANRLRKNQKHLRSWLRREGIECYRLYDADMPEYAVAVDVYGDFVHVAEYKAPSSVSEQAAARRLEEVRTALPGALHVPASNIVYKERARQRGAAQYTRRDQRNELLAVREGAATLLVNLHDYLDTGLFLDHRPLRLRIGCESRGKDFLNLFCYTGAATVHAALGGARSTTSVDLSNTYLDWLGKNLRCNDRDTPQHRRIRADCMTWLQGAEGRYDLILLDPPSFSNSRALDDSFDVQRDHASLLRSAMGLLRPGGCLYFSNNRRGFRLDERIGEDYLCEDISAQTVDRDFARKQRIHQCWTVRPRLPGA